jgi:cytochrome c oxidase subunit 3
MERVDASTLPRHAHGASAPVFWGAVLFVCIEGTGFAMLVASFLYVRGDENVWPPQGALPLLPASIALGAYVLSIPPMLLAWRAALHERLGPARAWLVVSTVFGVAASALRAWEINAIPFKWTASAYASLVWTLIGLHVVETIASVGENLFLIAVLFQSKRDKRHFTDLEANAVFWLFVAAVWLPVFGLLYGAGR